ncbi:ABC transporter substrate-binding protein [Candidatus Sumerlaeota bacterium]|nr:ABC transporter substrate-binding protein [Candidatus Sumerlaeota bacterium]
MRVYQLRSSFLGLMVIMISTMLWIVACSDAGNAAVSGKLTVNLGYFPNVTHAQAVVGVADGTFAKALGPDVTLKPATFNAGPSVIEAVFGGQLDIAYIGPSPTLNGFIKSDGEEVRVIAGAVENGTLIVGSRKRGITKIEQLKGATIATPQLGNTQDISAKAYVTSELGGKLGNGKGETNVIPVANPDIEILFDKDQIDAAWIPEPWASRLLDRGLVNVIVEEKELWPEKKFLLTNVIVRRKFLEEHPDVVKNFLKAHVALTRELTADRQKFALIINAETKRITGKELPPTVIASSLDHVAFNVDPSPASFEAFFQKGKSQGLLRADKIDLDKLINRRLLDEVLKERAATQ